MPSTVIFFVFFVIGITCKSDVAVVDTARVVADDVVFASESCDVVWAGVEDRVDSRASWATWKIEDILACAVGGIETDIRYVGLSSVEIVVIKWDCQQCAFISWLKAWHPFKDCGWCNLK